MGKIKSRGSTFVTILALCLLQWPPFLFVSADPPTDVSPSELMTMLKAGNVKVFDVRNPYELRIEGRIAGSINIPLPQVRDAFALSPAEFQLRYKVTQPAKDDCNIIFHCKSGGRSYKAMRMARELGYYCARHLTGGFTAWKQLYGAKR